MFSPWDKRDDTKFLTMAGKNETSIDDKPTNDILEDYYNEQADMAGRSKPRKFIKSRPHFKDSTREQVVIADETFEFVPRDEDEKKLVDGYLARKEKKKNRQMWRSTYLDKCSKDEDNDDEVNSIESSIDMQGDMTAEEYYETMSKFEHKAAGVLTREERQKAKLEEAAQISARRKAKLEEANAERLQMIVDTPDWAQEELSQMMTLEEYTKKFASDVQIVENEILENKDPILASFDSTKDNAHDQALEQTLRTYCPWIFDREKCLMEQIARLEEKLSRPNLSKIQRGIIQMLEDHDFGKTNYGMSYENAETPDQYEKRRITQKLRLYFPWIFKDYMDTNNNVCHDEVMTDDDDEDISIEKYFNALATQGRAEVKDSGRMDSPVSQLKSCVFDTIIDNVDAHNDKEFMRELAKNADSFEEAVVYRDLDKDDLEENPIERTVRSDNFLDDSQFLKGKCKYYEKQNELRKKRRESKSDDDIIEDTDEYHMQNLGKKVVDFYKKRLEMHEKAHVESQKKTKFGGVPVAVNRSYDLDSDVAGILDNNEDISLEEYYDVVNREACGQWYDNVNKTRKFNNHLVDGTHCNKGKNCELCNEAAPVKKPICRAEEIKAIKAKNENVQIKAEVNQDDTTLEEYYDGLAQEMVEEYNKEEKPKLDDDSDYDYDLDDDEDLPELEEDKDIDCTVKQTDGKLNILLNPAGDFTFSIKRTGGKISIDMS